MNVLDILGEYLTEKGYDGLCMPDYGDGCGCVVGDLVPCGDISLDCEAAYRYDCWNCAKKDTGGGCPLLLFEDHDVLYSPRKDYCQPDYKEAME
ncbi:MAG: hypothetical protein FWD72_01750 [Eggerthellaceae bacterium]|nr:hypothetical protein [Eggerthellaceae bacterium]